MGYGASVTLTPQAPLAGVQIEPDVPRLPAAVTPDPTDRGTGRQGATEPIGERIAAPITRSTRHLLRPRHHVGDHVLGERWIRHGSSRGAHAERTPDRAIPRGHD